MNNIIESFRISLNDMLTARGMDSVKFGKVMGVDPSIVRRWRNKGVDVRLKTLIKIADMLDCSIEYLCGKTHEYVKFESQKDYPVFGQRLASVMSDAGIKPYQLFRDTTIIPSKYYYWLEGGEPSLSGLEIVAQYLNVTLDHLIGRKTIT